jgi:hypothetical protein
MASTYEKIATTTGTGSSGVFTFSSIPSTYTDIKVVLAGTTSSNGSILLTFNSDTATNYSLTSLAGSGTTASSGRGSTRANIFVPWFYGFFGSTQANLLIDVMNYSNATTYKTALCRVNTDGGVEAVVGLWRSTSAISTITLTTQAGNFTTATTATLYGIKAA